MTNTAWPKLRLDKKFLSQDKHSYGSCLLIEQTTTQNNFFSFLLGSFDAFRIMSPDNTNMITITNMLKKHNLDQRNLYQQLYTTLDKVLAFQAFQAA